jgi:hypothetical protein
MKDQFDYSLQLKKEKSYNHTSSCCCGCCCDCCSVTLAPKEGLVAKVFRHQFSEAKLPVRYDWKTRSLHTHSAGYGMQFEYFRVYHNGPNLSNMNNGDLVIEQTGGDVWYPTYTGELAFHWILGMWVVFGVALVPIGAGITFMVADFGSDEANLVGKGLGILSFLGLCCTIPMLRAYKNYLNALHSKSAEEPAAKVALSMAKDLLASINQGFSDTGLTLTEYKVRKYLESKQIMVGESLGTYTDEYFDLCDQYHRMNKFRPEDKYFLKAIGDPQVRTRADFNQLMSKKSMIAQRIITEFGPTFSHNDFWGYFVDYEVIGDEIIRQCTEGGEVTSTIDEVIGLMEAMVEQQDLLTVRNKYDDELFGKMRGFLKAKQDPSADLRSYLRYFTLNGIKVKDGELDGLQILKDLQSFIKAEAVSSNRTTGEGDQVLNPLGADDIEMQMYPAGSKAASGKK